MASGKDLVIQSAVALLATGKAKDASEAVTMAFQVLDELDKVLTARTGKPERTGPRATEKTVATLTRMTAAEWVQQESRAEATGTGKRKVASAGASGAVKRPAAKKAAAAAKADKEPAQLAIRPRRALEKLGVLRSDQEVSPADLAGKICEAHLAGAKACSAATVKQIAQWFKAHGEQLPKECATFDANWLTNRCDEAVEA